MGDLSVSTPVSGDFLSSYLEKNRTAADLWKARRHLIDTIDLSRAEVDCLIGLAGVCKNICQMDIAPLAVLSHRTIANAFYENSTRTRSSFELAARRLGATVLNLDIQSSSVSKGETIIDTAQTLASMGAHAVVQRHASSGSANQVAGALGDRLHVLNAGDGWHAHPTQALLDLLTMLEERADLSGAKVAIVGDIKHSRVARSNIWLLKLYGADIHVSGPPTLVPPSLSELGLTVHNRLEPAIEQADFVIALRMQSERQRAGLIPSTGEYRRLYRLDHQRMRLAKPGAKIMHPGPVNRGVEITDELADDPAFSLIGRQVTSGVAVRMAALYLLLAGEELKQ